jgi:hypothetical protein
VEREIPESKAKAGVDVDCPECKTPAILASVTSWRVKQAPPQKNVSRSRVMRLRAWAKWLYAKLRPEKPRGMHGTEQPGTS